MHFKCKSLFNQTTSIFSKNVLLKNVVEIIKTKIDNRA